MSLVYKILAKLNPHLDDNLHPEAMIHSYQGVHYIQPEFQQFVKEMGQCHVEETASIMRQCNRSLVILKIK